MDTVRDLPESSVCRILTETVQDSPSSPSAPQQPPRTSPAEHAARVFSPEHVEPPPIAVRGPFIPTASSGPSDAFAQPAESSSPPPPSPNASSPPATSSLPAPTPAPEATPAGARLDSAEVEIVLDENQIKDAESWHRERYEKKLRGEYERMGKQLAEVVSLAPHSDK